MLQENPQAMVIMAMLLEEERRRNEVRRATGPQRMARRNHMVRWGRQLAGGLGAVLVTMGKRLQAHQVHAVPGESGGGV